jgi:glutathione S-transferase
MTDDSAIWSKISRLLERYGAALSSGDTPTIADCWAVPALVLADQGAIAVTDPAQVEAFFGQAVEAYHAQGLMTTRPELERVEMLTERMAAVDVRWPSFDASGAEQASERSHYIVYLGDDGEMRLRVTLTRTV